MHGIEFGEQQVTEQSFVRFLNGLLGRSSVGNGFPEDFSGKASAVVKEPLRIVHLRMSFSDELFQAFPEP